MMRIGSWLALLGGLTIFAAGCGGAGGRPGRDYGIEDEDSVVIDPGRADPPGDKPDGVPMDMPDSGSELDPGSVADDADVEDIPDLAPRVDAGFDETPLLDIAEDHPGDPGQADTGGDLVAPDMGTTDTVEATSQCEPPKAPGCTCQTGEECASGACDVVEGTRVCVIPCEPPDCDDGVACTKDECLLLFGTCVHPPDDSSCDDKNPCTQDACDPATACLFVPNSGTPCVDGDPCTTGDVCNAGVCVGIALAGCCKEDTDCDDNNACTEDSCMKETGECSHAIAGLAGQECDADGNGCTGPDRCKLGVCSPGPVIACNPAETPCQADAKCVSSGPFTHDCLGQVQPKGTPCSDGDTCTVGDVCDGTGACSSGPVAPNCCKTDADCNDKNPCTLDTCDPQTQRCRFTDEPVGTLCNADNDGCTQSDFCVSGICYPGTPVQCPAPEGPCIKRVCQSTGAMKYECKTVPIPVETVCDDNNPCTLDLCDIKMGKCMYSMVANLTPCDADGDGCTVGDACQAGVCTPGTPVTCPGGAPDPCKSRGCRSTGATTYLCVDLFSGESQSCDDGLFCTKDDHCDGEGKCIGGGPQDCGLVPGDCEIVRCDEKSRTCSLQAGPDGTPCDADDDGCTYGDACQAGACVAGEPVACGEAPDSCSTLVCTSEGADAFTCSPVQKPEGTACDDGMFCTVGETCGVDGVCSGEQPRDCEAEVGGMCRTTWCNEQSRSCESEPSPPDTPCEDGKYCTEGDACDGFGNCVSGPDRDCGRPSDACRDIVCVESARACLESALPDLSDCNADDDGCTAGDACIQGTCVAGFPVDCAMADTACAVGTCHSLDAGTYECVGIPKAAGTPCEDGRLCTSGDSCSWDGICTPGFLTDCEALVGSFCASAWCDLMTDQCIKLARHEGEACDDGKACTFGDRCVDAECVPVEDFCP